jgi:tetratricopeptide (TPR) repeat protein
MNISAGNRYNKMCQFSGQKLLRAVMTSVVALMLLPSIVHAQDKTPAQAALRPEIIKSLQTMQETLRAKNFESVITQTQQALATSNLTPVEKPYVQRILASAALEAKNFKLAIVTLESLIQEMPEKTEPDQKTGLIESLLSACQQGNDLERFVKWARIYQELGGKNKSVRPVLIQALSALKQYQDVVTEVKEQLRIDDANKQKSAESDLRLMAYSQRQLKDDAGYNASLKLLLQNYPSKAYWAELIPRTARQANFNARFDLDLYRLLEITGNLEDTTDYVEMINLSLKTGLPAEAVRVLEMAYSAGVLGKGSDAASHQKLKLQAQQKLNEDEKILPALEKSAKDANSVASLADVYASQLKWDKAAAAYAKAFELGGLRREAETRLHAGIALFKLGQKAEAQKMWQSIQGDPTALDLAQLWLIWQQTN